MYQHHSYTVKNYSNPDLITADIFEDHMDYRSINQKTTIEQLISFSKQVNGNDLDIDLEVDTQTDYWKISNGIHGGLAKAFGKGRVKKKKINWKE